MKLKENKKWEDMSSKEKRKSSCIGCSVMLALVLFLFLIIRGCIVGGNNEPITSSRNIYPKLSTSYYDSIYAFKAFPAIDQENPPRIDFKLNLKKVTVKVRLTKKLNEEELKSIGIYYHDKYLVAPYNRVYVFYYTPEYTKEDAGCYATTHSDPELEVNILDAAKYW